MDSLAGRRIGLIGLGLMGLPMARNLARAGADVTVFNRSPGPLAAAAAEGLAPAASPAALAAATEAVIVMVADTPAVEAVLGGPAGVLEGLQPGGLVIDMGTTEVEATRRLAAEVAARGGDFLDAPVSGGQVGAVEGTLTVMCGGTEAAAFARALPILGALGRRITHVGASGAGQIAKAANQMIVGMTIGAVAEALALARAAGADPAKVRAALEGGFAWSRIMELHGQRMIDQRYVPGGRVRTQLKDLTQAERLAEQHGVALPMLGLNRSLYQQLAALGHGDLDHAALFKLYFDDAAG